jgi:Family of unknown function (DUF5686)/CarboxypepD_reg-like domain
MKNAFALLISLSFSLFANAQLTGKITNSKGEVLPFANVYLEGTTRGTTANTEGSYFFDVPNGTYRVVYQSIGYTKKIESVIVSGKTTHDVSLNGAEVELAEVVIKANAEDPAYPIMRKAIENRSYFLRQVKSYSCDVYIKGLQRIADAPKKFMGQDLGDMGGTVDSTTRSGIIYLAETVSKLNVSGNDKKEALITSKVSGDNNGFGFNRATLFDFNLYENFNNDLPRKLMSPIAENAMNNYRYKLISSSKIDDQNVYKIQVIPIRKEDPTWAGFVYIVDNQWNMQATDLFVTGKSLQQDVVDTVWLQQNFIKINKDVWRVFNQRLDFKFNLLGFKFKGFFNGVFSNYNINPAFPKGYFGDELFTALNATKTNDLTQWETIRPIPLTAEEIKDYSKKDSIQTVHHSKPYIDSMMHRANRFKPFDLLFGYTYRDDYKSTVIGFGSALSAVNFNAVQGLNLVLPFKFSKQVKDSMFADTHANWSIDPSVNYSFGEHKWRGEVTGNFLFNYFKRDNLSFGIGQKVQQFNANNIISEQWAAYQALYEKRHIYFIYDKIFAKIAYQREISNGLMGKVSFEAAKRQSLTNSTQYSFRDKDALFGSNEPVKNPSSTNPISVTNDALLGDINLMWTPRQKYTTYPWGKLLESPTYPIFKAHLQHAFGNGTSNYADFTRMELSIEQKTLQVGLVGTSEIRAEFGGFLDKKSVSFIDYKHFNGNDLNLSNSNNFMRGFLNLPYYEFSTTGNYFMVNYQHHFEGFILGKIPLIRKLGLKEIARVGYLNTSELGNYAEVGFGIENIGYALFRIIRLDLSWQYQNGQFNKKPKFLVGINLPF